METLAHLAPQRDSRPSSRSSRSSIRSQKFATGTTWLPLGSPGKNRVPGYVVADLPLRPLRSSKPRERKRKALVPPLPSASAPRPHPVLRYVELARKWFNQIEAGEVKNRADLAKREGVTRARVTQVLDLLLLDKEVLKLFGTVLVPPSGTPITERKARDLLFLDGAEQVKAAERMVGLVTDSSVRGAVA